MSKKLSIEEKAQAYDKALEIINDYYQKIKYSSLSNASADREVLENAFPQLKENEDERIKGAIIDHLKDNNLIEWATWLEKQVVQKEIDYNEELKKCKDNPLYFFDKYVKVKLKENKPAWSEEDKEALEVAIIALEDMYDPDEPETCYAGYTLTFDKAAERLKSLKDRVQLQPKQEWSEEDIKNLNRISLILLDASEVKQWWKEYRLIEKDEMEKLTNWLKILKERIQPQNLTVTDEELAQAKKEAYNDALNKIEYHSGEPTFDDGWSAAIWYLKKRNVQPQSNWKPSKEQLHYLSWIANVKLGDSVVEQEVSKHLNELYGDLKKLRKE